MIKYRILTFFTFFILGFSISLKGQNIDDALTYSSSQPTGTARSIALGGAMGALGGDYSAIAINPAGIAVYRSSEFSFTPSLIYSKSNSKYYNTESGDDKFSFPINQISYVGTSRLMRKVGKGLVSTHFAIGYNRTQNYNRKNFIQGYNINSSLLDGFVYDANNYGLTPFYSDLAYKAFLLDPVADGADTYYNAFEYLDDEGIPQWGPKNGLNQNRINSESGYSGNFNLTYGANFSNTLFLGATVTLATLHYEKDYEHYEEVAASENQWDYLDHYSFSESLTTNGTGIKLKIGAIYKPIQSLRIGASFQTPTFYSIDEDFSTSIRVPNGFANKQLYESDLGESSYNFRTPYQAIGSIAYIIGSKGLVSIDYEYTNFGLMEFKSKNTNSSDVSFLNSLNDNISNEFRATHDLRFGAEYRILPTLSLRGGYATYQNPYKNQLIINKEDETKDKFNIQSDKYDISGGIGFKYENMSLDIAYLYRHQTYVQSLYYSADVSDESQYPVEITNKDHQIAVTLGWRF
jgi:hypothetical protein